MANRDDQPFRGLERDHYRRSGLKDAVSHYLSPPNPLTSTAPQPFPNNLTMPPDASATIVATSTSGISIRNASHPMTSLNSASIASVPAAGRARRTSPPPHGERCSSG